VDVTVLRGCGKSSRGLSERRGWLHVLDRLRDGRGGRRSAMITVGLALALVGCGQDACESLCKDTARRLEDCVSQWPTDWGELDAKNQRDFRTTCQDRWSESRADLEPRELDDALEQCDDSTTALAVMGRGRTTCDQLRALYLGD